MVKQINAETKNGPILLDPLGTGQLLIGDSGDVHARDVSGDVTIDKDGVTAIGAAKVKGTHIDHTMALRFLPFGGHNGNGACAAVGLKVGDRVLGVVNVTDGTDDKAKFESLITVNDQIQQQNGADLSTKAFVLLALARS